MRALAVMVLLVLGYGRAAAVCSKIECADDNRCFGNGGISCRQGQQCVVNNGQASWRPIEGGGVGCGTPFKITILQAVAISNIDSSVTRDFTSIVEGHCKSQGGEVCTFKIKNPGGLLGDPIPGAHVKLAIRYICRSATLSRGTVRIEFANDLGDANFNCID